MRHVSSRSAASKTSSSCSSTEAASGGNFCANMDGKNGISWVKLKKSQNRVDLRCFFYDHSAYFESLPGDLYLHVFGKLLTHFSGQRLNRSPVWWLFGKWDLKSVILWEKNHPGERRCWGFWRVENPPWDPALESQHSNIVQKEHKASQLFGDD